MLNCTLKSIVQAINNLYIYFPNENLKRLFEMMKQATSLPITHIYSNQQTFIQ